MLDRFPPLRPQWHNPLLKSKSYYNKCCIYHPSSLNIITLGAVRHLKSQFDLCVSSNIQSIFNFKYSLIAGCYLIGPCCFLISNISKILSFLWLFFHQSKSPAAPKRERVAIETRGKRSVQLRSPSTHHKHMMCSLSSSVVPAASDQSAWFQSSCVWDVWGMAL